MTNRDTTLHVIHAVPLLFYVEGHQTVSGGGIGGAIILRSTFNDKSLAGHQPQTMAQRYKPRAFNATERATVHDWLCNLSVAKR